MKKLIPIFFSLLIIAGIQAQTQNNQSALSGVLPQVQKTIGIDNSNNADNTDKSTAASDNKSSSSEISSDYSSENADNIAGEEAYDENISDEAEEGVKLTVDQVVNPRSNAMYNPYVVDMCHAFSPSELDRITDILENIEITSTCQVIVVALPGIEGDNEDDFAYELFNKWGIGVKGKDNGLLVLYVKDIRAIRFETGFGLEGILPDAYLSEVMHDIMFPLLKEGRVGDAFINALDKIGAELTSEEAMQEFLAQKQPVRYTAVNVVCYWLIISVIVTLLIAFSVFKKTSVTENSTSNDVKSGKGKARSPEDVDLYLAKNVQSFKFLGFLFPTLFLFGLYLKKLRQNLRLQPQVCPQCGGKMHLLQPTEARQYFTKGDAIESRLHSAELNYWQCDNCKYIKRMSYQVLGSKYTKCPSCGAYAVSVVSNRILSAATTTHSGTKELTHRCQCCNHEYTTTQVLPKIASGGNTSGGGSFGSGGASFGGGRSGGGGVSGRF